MSFKNCQVGHSRARLAAVLIYCYYFLIYSTVLLFLSHVTEKGTEVAGAPTHRLCFLHQLHFCFALWFYLFIFILLELL